MVTQAKKKKKAPKLGPPPVKTTAFHFGSGPSDDAYILLEGVDYALVDARDLDTWEVLVEPASDWPVGLVVKEQRQQFIDAWERGRWPLEMIDEVVKGALSLILGNDWGSCRAITAIAFETAVGPRLALDFARHSFDPWLTPAHQLPPILYAAIVEPLQIDPRNKIDKMIREFADTVTTRAANTEMQDRLDEFDAFLDDLGVDLTGEDEEE